MKNILYDLGTFIKSLSFIDIMFIVSILGLVILIVTLIYIIKMNDDDTDESTNIEIDKIDTNDEELDLLEITKELNESPTKPIVLNDYEKEQEEKAIISYDELLKTKDLKEDINYIKEENIDGLTVKSVDPNELTKPIELPKIKEEYHKIVGVEENTTCDNQQKNILISYEKEEEFLKALKKLQNLLN
ncbi:MAG: hypothetical protein IJ572_01880 [Bacilli bacterium]|nr:hypothetical protein [Bacilli bacterium]